MVQLAARQRDIQPVGSCLKRLKRLKRLRDCIAVVPRGHLCANCLRKGLVKYCFRVIMVSKNNMRDKFIFIDFQGFHMNKNV